MEGDSPMEKTQIDPSIELTALSICYSNKIKKIVTRVAFAPHTCANIQNGMSLNDESHAACAESAPFHCVWCRDSWNTMK